MTEAPSTRFSALTCPLVGKPALAGKAPLHRTGVSQEPIFGGHVVQVLARASDLEASDAIRKVTTGWSGAPRPVSPHQWFIVGDSPLSEADLQTLAASLTQTADIVDQSHGRARMRLRGPNAAQVLAKGTAIDLDLANFSIGTSATTLIGHIGAHVTRIGRDCFELIVLRGFAESLWSDLEVMSREFLRGGPL